MAEIVAVYIQPDGTHVIPVRRIYRPGETPNEHSSGDVRWSRRDGLTFRFQTLLTSFFDFPTEPFTGGAGVVRAVSMEQEWYAETADGSPVRLYATSYRASTSMTTRSIEKGSGAVSSKQVQGTACYAEVGFHRDSPLAYWHETPPGPRLYSPGWEIGNWGVRDQYEYKINDTIYKGTRRAFPLGTSDNRVFVAAPDRENGLKGIWLTYQQHEQANPFWFPEACDRLVLQP